MPIVFEDVRVDTSKHSFALPVEVQGRTIKVGQGSFKIAGTEYELTEEQEFVVPEYDVTTIVSGYLAKKISDGSVAMLVDEMGPDETLNLPAEYKILERVFTVTVSPGAGELAEVLVKRFVVSMAGMPPGPDRGSRAHQQRPVTESMGQKAPTLERPAMTGRKRPNGQGPTN